MRFPHHQCFITTTTTIIWMFPLCFCDPRIAVSGLFCNPSKAKTSNFVPTFVKEMETLSQLISTSNNPRFATYNLKNNIYAMAQCHDDLSRTDCLLCFAAARTKLPRCLPSLSAAIFLDGCFLRYDTYSFYQESLSPPLDTVKCSSDNATVDNVIGLVESVGYAVGNASRIAVEKGGGFGAVKVMGIYALAQCWDSVGRDGCKECLDKAGKGVVKSCGMKKEGRGFNAGCYLRYSTQKFFNDGAEDSGDDHGKF